METTEILLGGPQFKRARRYYLHQRFWYLRVEKSIGQASVWQAKQEAEPGTPLAADFPYLALLVAAGYSTVEDIDGADQAELMEAGLSAAQASTALAALPPL